MLSPDEVARRLDLPVRTVERWARQGRIPAVRDGDELRFDERELEPWAREHRLVLGPGRARDAASAAETVSLDEAMRRGGVHFAVPAGTPEEALHEAARRTPVGRSHHDRLTERLLQREELSSTGIGGGVAIPHPRTPMGDVVRQPSVTVCYLDRELDLGAVDGRPVHTLLVILSPDTRGHLRLLARVAYRLRDPAFRQLLQRRAPLDDLLRAIAEQRSDGGAAPAP